MLLTTAEENYLKGIFKINERGTPTVSTNALAKEMNTAAASVTDMVRRLSAKGLVDYQKYHGASLSSEGQVLATKLIRKHRLWEVFLCEKLKITWDKVHDIAEQLEHVESDLLIERLDKLLDHPKFDPHGDPIPNALGKFTLRTQQRLDQLQNGQSGVVVGVREHSSEFLQMLDQKRIHLGTELTVIERFDFDQSVSVQTINGDTQTLTVKVANNLLVRPQSTGI